MRSQISFYTVYNVRPGGTCDLLVDRQKRAIDFILFFDIVSRRDIIVIDMFP